MEPLYDYPETHHLYSEHGRFYSIEGQRRPLPSVTTILSCTSDHHWLEEWRNRVGEAEADRIVAESQAIGNGMHDLLEQHYRPSKDIGTVPAISRRFADIIKKKALSRVSEVWAVEAALYYPDAYAGSSDLIGILDGTVTMMDYKNSRQDKKEAHVHDYKLQAAAYCAAHNKIYGTDIKNIAIFMMCRSGKYLEFNVKPNEYERYEDLWFERVISYYKKYGVMAP